MKLTLKQVIGILADYNLKHCLFPTNPMRKSWDQLINLIVDEKKTIYIASDIDTWMRRLATMNSLYQVAHILKGDLCNLPPKRADKIICQEANSHFKKLFNPRVRDTGTRLTLREAIKILAEYDVEHCEFPENNYTEARKLVAGIIIDEDKKIIINSGECSITRRNTAIHELLHGIHYQSGYLDLETDAAVEKIVYKQTKKQHRQIFCPHAKKMGRKDGGKESDITAPADTANGEH